MQHLIHTCRCECLIRKRGQCSYALLQKPLKACSDYVECEIKYSKHYHYKARYCRVFACKNTVDALTSDTLPALLRFYHGALAYFLNKCKAHIRNCSTSVKTSLLLHLDNQMLYCIFLILIKMKLL